MSHLTENPPWATRAIKENRLAILHEGPSPILESELGCGSYGCVYETTQQGTVFKITSDETEAEFIRYIENEGIAWPEGIVRYHRVIDLVGSFRRRPLYGIWREQAAEVGMNTHFWGARKAREDYDFRMLIQFEMRLAAFKDASHLIRESFLRTKDPAKLLDKVSSYSSWAWDQIGADDVRKQDYGDARLESAIKRYRGAQRVAYALRACQIIAELMGSEPEGYLIGQALEHFLEKGILLADVHSNNVGKVYREEYVDWAWVITDPGHVLILGDWGT